MPKKPSNAEVEQAVRRALREGGLAPDGAVHDILNEVRRCCAVEKMVEGNDVTLTLRPPEALPAPVTQRIGKALGCMRAQATADLQRLLEHPFLGPLARAVMDVPAVQNVTPRVTQEELRAEFVRHLRALSIPEDMRRAVRRLSNHFIFAQRKGCPFIVMPASIPEDTLREAVECLQAVPEAQCRRHIPLLLGLPHDGNFTVLLRDMLNGQFLRWTDPACSALDEPVQDAQVGQWLDNGIVYNMPHMAEAMRAVRAHVSGFCEQQEHPGLGALDALMQQAEERNPSSQRTAGAVRREMLEYCATFPQEMTALHDQLTPLMESTARQLLQEIGALAIDPAPERRMDIHEHPTVEDIANATGFLHALLLLSAGLKRRANSAIVEEQEAACGLPLLVRDIVRSSVCQSLMLQYVQRHMPDVFLHYNAGESHDARNRSFGAKHRCLMEWATVFERAGKTLAGPDRTPTQGVLLREVAEWVEGMRECAALHFAAWCQMPLEHDGACPAPQEPLPCLPPFQYARLQIMQHNGMPDDEVLTHTTHTLQFGPRVLQTTTPLDGYYKAHFWRWQPMGGICHHPGTVIPLREVLLPSAAGNIYIARKQAHADQDIADWLQAAQDTGMMHNVATLLEQGISPNLISIVAASRGNVESVSAFFMHPDQASHVLGARAWPGMTEDHKALAERLRQNGVCLDAESVVIPWTVSDGWEEMGEEETTMDKQRQQLDDLLHRTKRALLTHTHSDVLPRREVNRILAAAGIRMSDEKGGGGHYTYVGPNGQFTAHNRPIKDGEMYRHTLERIIVAIGDIDALEAWVAETHV